MIRRYARAVGRGLGCCALGLGLLLSACGKNPAPSPAPQPAPAAQTVFTILAGSELRDLEPALLKAAASAGVQVKFSYAGTLEIVERVNLGESFDAMLPPNGAYPSLALNTKPVAKEKLFYSRVALGVKAAKLKALGWDKRNPNWADIAAAAKKGDLRYAMTNPANSNTGMSALFAVASAVAGKTEDLTVKEVNVDVIKGFLQGQKLTAGSSGWLAEAFVKEAATLDAMVNYESVILRTNDKLGDADKLTLVYPQDGVISADYPLMLLNAAKQATYTKLVVALRSPEFQREAASTAFMRPAIADVSLAPGLGAAPVAELTYPNNLDVIDALLGNYQGEWRRPATSIFVLDISGSMRGERLGAMRDALRQLASSEVKTPSERYARFQNREHVRLIAFSNYVRPMVSVNFDTQALDAARQQIVQYADNLNADGGTAIFSALINAQDAAERELAADPNRAVSIVLLTDGENNVSPDLAGYKRWMAGKTPVRVFPILFGEGSSEEMNALAQITGGRAFDGRKVKMAAIFKEIRGYQ